MRPISEIDQIHLVPLDGETLVDAFLHAPDGDARRVEHDAEGRPAVHEGDLVLLEVLAEVPGGCLVRLLPVLGDAHELASFVADGDAAQAISSCEEAAAGALDLVEAMGGLEAMRIKGKWRPIMPNARLSWSAHVSAWNVQTMRAQAATAPALPRAA
jgi:hypothetical protein